MYIYVYTYKCIYIYINVHAHIYTYTYINVMDMPRKKNIMYPLLRNECVHLPKIRQAFSKSVSLFVLR